LLEKIKGKIIIKKNKKKKVKNKKKKKKNNLPLRSIIGFGITKKLEKNKNICISTEVLILVMI